MSNSTIIFLSLSLSFARTYSDDCRSANKQFIQDRIRHLIDAFSYRAQATRERIQMPPTPSSISSHDTLGDESINVETILDSIQKIEDTSSKKPEPPPKIDSFLKQCKHLLDTKVIDPQGKIYVAWMSITAMAVLYNVWMIPLRSTFPYQTAKNRAVWMSFDYFADLIYVVDIFLIQPRIMFLSEGFWMKDFNFTRQNYVRKKRFKVSGR